MSHLSHEALWAFASDDGGAQELAAVRTHLDGCADCKRRLAEVQRAQALLKPRGGPAPLLDASAKRIGDVLARAAEEQAMKRMSWRGWWAWKPILMAAATALLLWAVWAPKSVETVAPVALVALPEKKEEPVPQGVAQVTSARKASIDGADKVARNQQLKTGTKVATFAGGALWLKLPDGSRAGLTASTEVTIEELSEKKTALEVTNGSLLVVARHDPAHEFRVYAGEVEVRDVGTRFLVAREMARVAVAVEEGSVEVRVGEKLIPLEAGQEVEVARGRTRDWKLPKKAPPEQQLAVVSPQPPPEDLPVAPAVGEVDAGAAVPAPVAVAPVPEAVPDAGVAAPPPEEPLDSIGLAFKRFGEALARPFLPTRAGLAERINDLADEGNCDEANQTAKAWLAKDGGTALDDVRLRHLVLRAQLRCFTRNGKGQEADAVRKQLPP